MKELLFFGILLLVGQKIYRKFGVSIFNIFKPRISIRRIATSGGKVCLARDNGQQNICQALAGQ
jgi:hypothetical protein